jgi:hypothetical protein
MRTTTMGRTAKLMALCAVFAAGALAAPRAEADRCTQNGSGSWSCTHSYRVNWYSCNGIPIGRGVRWQVPEGTPPAGGWPVAFFYHGTSPADTNPFLTQLGTLFGANYTPQIIHELLDDPSHSGKKYAVVAPEPPQAGLFLEFWNTNSVFPYSVSCDYDFFPDLFAEIKGGSYGTASRFNMSRRYAFGISSGGYNTSRMAVTFNQAKQWYQSCAGWCNQNTWRALAIVSASYATCAGPVCSVPNLPSNHPPTKFWHGTGDLIVPLWTADAYFDELAGDGKPTEFQSHGGGHEFNATQLGATGVKDWFDEFP